MASIDNILPDDAIMEIFTRLEPDDLTCCLGVNRKFYNMVNPIFYSRNSTFKLCKPKTFDGYLSYDGIKYLFIADGVKCVGTNTLTHKDVFDKFENFWSQRYTTVEAVSQCRGLICCVRRHYLGSRYYVCKPATGQFRAIPNPKIRYETAGTAIVASLSGQQFKILRLSLPRDGRSLYLRCEIFDSRTWKWNRCNDIKEDIRFSGVWPDNRGVFAHGSIHWLTEQGIFAFNMHKETWKWINLPVAFADFDSKHRAKITLWDEKLSLVHISDTKAVTWVMNNYFDESWGPQLVVNFTESGRPNNWLLALFKLFYPSSFATNCLRNKNWEEVFRLIGTTVFCGDVFRFQSDATPCKILQLPEPSIM